MIAANEQVARMLGQRGVPALYRVHERPEAAAVERLIEQLASLGVPTPPVAMGTDITPQQAADMSARPPHSSPPGWRAGRARAAGVDELVLRSLKQA